MGFMNRVESGLSKAVHGAFAKAFKSEVQPVEIASAIRSAMDRRAALLGPGRAMVPNIYTIELSTTDYDRLEQFEADLADDLVAAAMEHADTQGYQPAGALEVTLIEGDNLETGVFRVRPATSKRAGHDAAEHDPRDRSRSYGAGSNGSYDDDRSGHGPNDAYGSSNGHGAGNEYGDDQDRTHRNRDNAGAATRVGEPVRPAPRRQQTIRPWLDIDGERYPLLGSLTTIGRDESADIVIDDPGVSRRHCEVRVTTDGPHLVTSIRDLGSTNGTFVNGERISSTRLGDGDRLTIGRTNTTFRAGKR